MATTFDLLNEVLTGLRKERLADGTTSVTSAYHLLLLQFVNMAKDEVENKWDWHALRTTVTQALSQGTSSYTLSGVTNRARLLYENPTSNGEYNESSQYMQGSRPMVFDVTDAAEYRLGELTPEAIERLHLLDADEQNDPTHFALQRTASGITLRVYPTPADTRSLRLRFVAPQAKLEATSIDSTTLSVPDSPVWLRALELANKERGEEVGQDPQTLLTASQTALYDAIAIERTDADDTGYPV
jgi:hypothetical protein